MKNALESLRSDEQNAGGTNHGEASSDSTLSPEGASNANLTADDEWMEELWAKYRGFGGDANG